MSSIVQIKDSAYDGLQSLTVYGNTRQNLWANPSGVNAGVTVTANADGSITVSGTATNSAFATVEAHVIKPSTQYTFSCDKAITFGTRYGFIVDECGSDDAVIMGHYLSSDNSTTKVTFTTSADLAYVRFGVSVAAGATASGTYRVMLNEGSTAEPWCPPGLNSVGDDGSVDIVTAGKNLLKQKSNLTAKTVNGIKFTPNGDGSIKVSGTSTGVADFYLIGKTWNTPETNFLRELQEEMVLSGGSKDCEIVLYGVDDDGNHVLIGSTTSIEKVIPGDSKGLKLGNWLCYLSIAVNKTIDTVVYPQLELGSTATAYEPPNIITTPIDLQGHTLNALPDGTRDELHIDGGGNVVLEKRTQKVQLDGDANWLRNETPFVHYISSWSNFDGLPSGYVSEKHYVDKLPASSNVSNGLYSAGANGGAAYVREPAFASNAAGVKTWMGANTPTVILPLLEPQTIDLGTVDLPKLRKKPLVNNIWANGTSEGTGFSLAPEIDCEYNRWSTYCDGFKTHGKHSYFDMGCCLAARDTGTPEKKSVTATVPYMSGFYDLSKLYGAIAFEARQLTYRFEFVEDSREELQQKKSQFLEWLSQVHDEEIADDDIPGRHFIGSLSEWEFEEGEEGQSGSLEVTFNCQPFLEADEDTTKTCNAGSNTVTVEGQAVNAYAKTSSGTATIQIGGVTQSVGTSEIRLSVQLQPGDNTVTVTGSPVVLRWKELTV